MQKNSNPENPSSSTTGPVINGTVHDAAGNPVENATVRVRGVDFADLSGTIEEKRDRAAELTELANEAAPSNWTNSRFGGGQSETPPEDIINTQSTYVVAHSPQDWDIPDPTAIKAPLIGDTGYQLRDPKLGFGGSGGPYCGANTAPAGETIVFSVWKGQKNPFIQDRADEDLPGVTSEGQIIIEQLGPGGGDNVVDRTTIKTKGSIGGTRISKEHNYATATLSSGIYRIAPKSNPSASCLLGVGNPQAIIQGWAENLRTQAGALTSRAKELRELQSNGTFVAVNTSTNATGYYEVTLPSQTVNTTSVIAYKAPDAAIDSLNKDPQNITRADAREYYESLNISTADQALDTSSMYVATGAKTVSPPASDVNLTVVEIQNEPYVSINQSENISDAVKAFFSDLGMSKLAGYSQQFLESLSRDQLEDLYLDEVAKLEDSPNITSTALSKAGLDSGAFEEDVDNLTVAQMLTRIRAINTAIQQQDETIDSTTSVDDAVEDAVKNLEFSFESPIEKKDVTVIKKLGNGTTKVVNNTRYRVEERVLDQTETVVVEPENLTSDDPPAVEYVTRVVNDGETGSDSITVRNPSFTGQLPALQSVSFSTLSPGPSETVSITATGGEAFGSIQAIDVIGPDGTAVPTNLSNGRATFQTAGEGRHSVALTVSNGAGANITETIEIDAISGQVDSPATIRLEKSFGRPYVLVGDDLAGGELETRHNNARVDVLALVGANDDPPPTIHTHAETIDQPPDATTCTQLARGQDKTAVRQRVTVVTHLSKLGENAYVYRKVNGQLQPIDSDSSYGSVTRGKNGTQITTYSSDSGRVCVRTVSNPGTFADLQWRYQQIQENIPDIGVPFVGVVSEVPAL